MVKKHSWALVLAGVALAAPGELSAQAGAVFVGTNHNHPVRGNEVVRYIRFSDGTLELNGYFPTGGLGSGAPLVSQGSLALSSNRRFLFAVNPGSDSITSFRVSRDGLRRVATVDSGGDFPVSLATRGRLLFVLHAGASPGVSAFRVSLGGELSPLAQRSVPLPQGLTTPTQVSFTPNGNQIVVSIKDGPGDLGAILVLSLSGGALPKATLVPTPIGFAFPSSADEPTVVAVTEIDGQAVSTYEVGADGSLRFIDRGPSSKGVDLCWLENNGRFLYAASPGGNALEWFSVLGDGSVRPEAAVDIPPRSMPTDLAASADGRFLYQLAPGTGRIEGFAIGDDGALTPLGGAGGLGALSAASGLVVR